MSIRVRALAVLAAIAVVACGRTPSPVEPVVEPPEPSDGTTVVAPAGTTIVWTKGESPCFILDTLTVERHETLVVEPGVDVLFADSAYAEILGAIRALGTEADSIRFIKGAAGVGAAFSSPAPSDAHSRSSESAALPAAG